MTTAALLEVPMTTAALLEVPMTAVTDGLVPVVEWTADGAVLRPLGPFSLDETRAFVGVWEPSARLAPGADEPLRLTAALDGSGEPVGFAVTQDAGGDVHVSVAGTDRVDVAVAQLARVLSLDHDARAYPAVGGRLPAVGALMDAHPGLRPTLFGSPYEAAVWGVLSARVASRQAAALHARMSADHGVAMEVGGAVRHAFPSPSALLRVDAVPGLPAEKLRRLHGLAEGVLDGRLDVGRLRALGGVAAREELRTLRGIGPFWAAGVWHRACGVVDEFPAEEPRCRAALARVHGRPEDSDLADLADLIEQLAPFRQWAALLVRVAA